MKDIPLKAKVECTDGPCRKSGIVILNPETRDVTHFVVQDRALPDREQRLVPIGQVVETSRNQIRLSCTKTELAAMDHLVDAHYEAIHHKPNIDYPLDFTARSVPRTTLTEPRFASETVEHIPPGELAVRRGTKVAARDGHVGQVAELVLNPETGHISHFVLEEGHLWGKKEVTVPVTAIDYLLENTFDLKLDAKEVETLPAAPVKRHFGRQ